MTTDWGLPVETVARQLLADYGSEYDASHLTWLDFADQARRIVDALDSLAETGDRYDDDLEYN